MSHCTMVPCHTSHSMSPKRTRFESETMPKRKAAAHDFDEQFSFTSPQTQATSGEWYAILAQQADAKKFLLTCEQMAFNLGEQWVALDSIRGAGDSTIQAVKDVAFTDMTPKLGPQMVINRVLEKLQQGAATADDFNDRRWGEGQNQANNAFRAFFASMVEKHGEAALSGIEVFVSKADREAEVAAIPDHTWALISDKPDAIKLYGKNPVAGKGHNSNFRKVLSRKFNEAAKKHKKSAQAGATTNMAQQAGSIENADPNVCATEEGTAS